jgi:HD-like signal output (HDOD) protein/CheY-like chemotaxis protein
MINILFVDDEVNVLEGMERAFHRMRREWSMRFVSSGPNALEALARSPADVIVSDMRMPGMDGWQLLAEVKRLYPQTVRLVLSGHADPGAIMRLVGTAHQYIAKPGESATLKAAIAQTQLLKHLLSSEHLAQLVGGVGSLPSCPKAFQEISQCLKEPDASIAQAARIIERDVAMTASVMKLVNSAFFGARQPIGSVERAVAYLGFDTLAALVLGHGLFQSGASRAPESSAMDRLWQHSLDTAMASRAIAVYEKLPRHRVDEAFLTGLLHDVGRVILASRPCVSTQTRESAEVMDRDVDAHHSEVGAYLLGLWGFPSHIVAAVALYNTPHRRGDTGLDLTVLTHLADRLVLSRSIPPLEQTPFGIEPGLLEGLGLADHLPLWAAAIGHADPGTEPTKPRTKGGVLRE